MPSSSTHVGIAAVAAVEGGFPTESPWRDVVGGAQTGDEVFGSVYTPSGGSSRRCAPDPHPVSGGLSRQKPLRAVESEGLRPISESEVWMMTHPVWEPCTEASLARRPSSFGQCECGSIDCRNCRLWRMIHPPEARRFYEKHCMVSGLPPCSWCAYPTHTICDWCPMLPEGLPVLQVCTRCDELVGMCRVCFSVRRYEAEGVNQRCSNCRQRNATGHLSKCGKCLLVRYCSKECQQKDWKQHRKLCSVLCDSSQLPPLLFRWQMPGEGVITWER